MFPRLHRYFAGFVLTLTQSPQSRQVVGIRVVASVGCDAWVQPSSVLTASASLLQLTYAESICEAF